ncbi:glutamine--tRNA ligase/YqeY domain fusion protein [Myxococcus sp. CA051A]|uniref:Glutamine--tRNA ligase n=1 Tax=Myxococcus llanfairpwllgwyngyllgogerychwyrndrobwllllantysiliogogogochensis TaxID=2590453 RepID=A0A540WMV1_9BACT|nr:MULTISPECIES: glutamine--tRNA ligase/YqeY domain fusion protein [Myxococcus]NTX12973.1 glutamine--tRNA ligase/YqeY domain fusion protein [Myxococcus sp. CA056]NTX36576.1 glutamine--tRNA ligase/YqeY domain fusion protein [Myxococcus sp. CA033]NTX64883.1 glutamine--tRNA ligase/YqeY domain fusion protein [Myxococcus sp. CA051A]TQF10336.1 glutamine--tRNA ligase/YqeY domain fusion protein [Myxococcus llanfairpwllgwyngyllgogerychwyrndrobwllllantysiliogogogochensis]
MTTTNETQGLNFLQEIIEEDRRAGKHGGRVLTRFPPEPNGYLHIGHAKAICLNFGLAKQYGGLCNLRFDDTNPVTEDTDYVESIQRDVKWLGFDWDDRKFFASDYFPKLYDFAVQLIKQGKAYVCSLSADEIREYRGDFTTPGRDSPYRTRSVEENLDLFERMRGGEFPDGKHTLRAKIDMTSPNPVLRDPPIYRIRHAHHHRTGEAWPIYPLYDFAHCLSDAIEGITHSICTLEFENRRVLYDWIVDSLIQGERPHQYEFNRLNLNYTVMSKRKLLKLVMEKYVSGWDDPRMMTISGLRRRGFTPASIRDFATRAGVSKTQQLIDMGVLELCIREDLNETAPRAMAVLRPLKVVVENYPEGQEELLEVQNHPQKPEMGTRKVPFMRELFIEAEDFMEVPAKGFFRLAPGKEVRLRSAYFITCKEVIKDAAGNITELRCTYDPATRGGDSPDGRKVKGTLHWVPGNAPTAEVRLYDRLFSVESPDSDDAKDFTTFLNPASLEVLRNARVEPGLAQATPESRFQFERLGYFFADPKDSQPGKPVFNRTVTLKDSWVKEQGKGK